jgi:DNA-binding Xre family transcriptional regulator
MSGNKDRHIGGDFDDFLRGSRLLEECETAAIKRVLSWQLEQAMRDGNISKSELARRMRTSRAVVGRLLNPENPAVTLQTMEKAARSVNRRLCLELKPA